MNEQSLHDTIDPHEYLASDEMPGHEHEHHVHVTPFWTMFWVFVILLFLTALTVWSSRVQEFYIGNTTIELGGTAHIVMALVIAIVKGALVGAYFMHLKYDKPVMSIVVGSTLFGVVLFIGLTLGDLSGRGVVGKDEAGEIHKGGNLQLFAGETGEKAAIEEKADMNVVEYARQKAIAAAGNPAGEGQAADGGADVESESGADASTEDASGDAAH